MAKLIKIFEIKMWQKELSDNREEFSMSYIDPKFASMVLKEGETPVEVVTAIQKTYFEHTFTDKNGVLQHYYIHPDDLNNFNLYIEFLEAGAYNKARKQVAREVDIQRQVIQEGAIARERGRIKALPWWKRLFNKLSE